MRKNKFVRMNITITKEEREYLRKQAYLKDKSMSWIVRELIKEKIMKENI